MDQFDRGSRTRLAEETVRHRLAKAERSRELRRLIRLGDTRAERTSPRLIMTVLVVILVLVVAVVMAAGLSVEPEVESHETSDELRPRALTQELARVQQFARQIPGGNIVG